MADDLVSSYSQRDSFPLLNGYVIHIFVREGKNVVSSARLIHKSFLENECQCTLDAVVIKLRRLLKDFKSKKERKRDFLKLQCLLEEEFIVPVLGSKKSTPAPTAEIAVASNSDTRTVRQDCTKCPGIRKEGANVIKSLISKCSSLKKEKTNISVKYSSRKLNFTLFRKNNSIAKFKAEKSKLKKENAILTRKIASFKLATDTEQLRRSLQKECQKRRNAEIALSKLKVRVTELKQQLDQQSHRLAELESCRDPVQKDEVKKTKAFSTDMRLVMYKCLLCNVPVEKAGELIMFVVKMFRGQLSKAAPGPSTVSRMAYELGVISDIQTAEALVHSEGTTLAWDATSIDGTHINEVHIQTSLRTFYLQVGHLPGGKTEDYLLHITRTIKTLAETYAGYTKQDMTEVLDRMHSAITCTLSDRAAVNHCVSAELSLLLNRQLIELNCNVHPLDGLASGTRKALLLRDKELGTASTVFGRDCLVANFIYAVSKLRYKAGTGDPCGFKLFLEKTGLSQGVIPRYVGNRLHILFHSAGIIYHLRTTLMDYLNKYCTSASLRLSLLGDFKNEDVITQLRVLGLFGKIVTGPWMTTFYKNPDQLHHLQVGPYLRNCLTCLQQLQENPAAIITMEVSAFGRALQDDDVVLQSLRSNSTNQALCSIVTCVSSAMLTVLRRQLHRYLEGDLSTPSANMLDQTASAPLNNIAAERVLGSFDALSRKAPNASVGFIDGKVKAAMNDTLGFLLSKGDHVQKHLLKYATARAAILRLERQKLKKQCVATAHQRQVLLAQQRDKSARKKVEKEIKDLLATGNIDVILEKVDPATGDVLSCLIRKQLPVNCEFIHIWDVDGEDVQYSGKIKGFRQVRKSCNVDVCYEGSGPASVPLSEFLTDTVMGDLLPSTSA